MRLLTKLLLAILIPFVVINTIVFISTSNLSNDYLKKQFYENSQIKLNHLENNIQTYFEDLKNSLYILSKLIELNKNDKSEIKTVLEAFINRFPEIHSISIVDSNAEEQIRVSIFSNDNEKLESYFYSPLYYEAILRNDAFLGKIYEENKFDHKIIGFSLPMKDIDTGENAGVIIAKISLQNVFELMEQVLPKEGSIFLSENEKPVVITTSTMLINKNNIKTILNQIMIKKMQKGTIHLNLNKDTTITSIFKKINVFNKTFYLVLTQPDKVTFSLLKKLQNKNLAIVITGFIIFILFIIWIINFLTKPLNKITKDIILLTNKYESISKNKVKLNPPKNKDEIKALEHSFLIMKEALKNYQKEEENLRKCLENKVEEKVRQIRHQAYHDSLTGLPNRRLFNDRLEMAMAYSKRKKEKLAVLFVDLDNFKKINDSEGHDIGDLFLKQIAQKLLECCRKEDTVSRFGGDEFTIIITEIKTKKDVEEIAQKIIRKVSEPIEIRHNKIHSSASLGITIYPDDGDNVNQLIKNADIAMYSAKANGKNNYVFFTQSMNDSIYKLISMENEIRRALKKNEFILHYQPIVEPISGKIVACEALIRWQKNYNELIYPGEFLSIAEETNLMEQLTDFVLNQACKDASDWNKNFNLEIAVSVNISPKQFANKYFVEKIKNIISSHKLNPKLLHIEITENTLMENIRVNIDKMKELKEIGVKLSIDDFGTGYSSLSYLKQFSIDYLKIDKSFIQEIPNEKDIAIVKSIISLAHSMNLKIIAEGIENKEQVEILSNLNCDYLQGYYYSKPIMIYDLELIIEIQKLNLAIRDSSY